MVGITYPLIAIQQSRCIYTYYFLHDYSLKKHLLFEYLLEFYNLFHALSKIEIFQVVFQWVEKRFCFYLISNGILYANKFRVVKQKCLSFASRLFILLILTYLLYEKRIKKIRWICHLQYIFKNSPHDEFQVPFPLSKTKMRMHNSLCLQILTYFLDIKT
jgi:hypothetical protein